MKFKQNASFENMVQSPRTDLLQNGLPLKGKWHKEFFKNNRPIVLELGCGKGEYTVGLAEKFPDKNFIYEMNGILPKIINTIDTYSILALSKNPIDWL